jgi:uncharacterized membrane protein YccC
LRAIGWKPPGGTQWRYCVKVGLAAALGYLLTQGTENQYAIYSAFTAALVVGASVGEDLATSANRVKGTLVGMLAGMAVSLAFGPSFVAVALAVGLTALLSISLGWGVPAARIGVTLCIITLVTHHADALEYNTLRAFNTLIGVVLGLAVSFLVWPVHAHDALRRATGASLLAAERLLQALAAGSQDLRPPQLDLYDALADLVKAARERNVEKQVFDTRQPDSRALQILQFGLEVLAATLAREARVGDSLLLPVEALSRRLDELRASWDATAPRK